MGFLPTRWYALCQSHLEKLEKNDGAYKADPICDVERCEWNIDAPGRRCTKDARWSVWVPGEESCV